MDKNNSVSGQRYQEELSAVARLKLVIISATSMAVLVVIMVLAGDNQVNAYNNDTLFALQNSRVEVVPVQMQDAYVKMRKIYGLVESAKQVELGFELSGNIINFIAREGDFVKKNQKLAVLDTSRLDAQLQQLDASLKRAKAEAEIAELSKNRLQDLVDANLDSTQNLDQARARLKAANARVEEVVASISVINVELQKSILVAPFDGQIVSQRVDLGTTVSLGQPIFDLISVSQLEARVGLPVDYAYKVATGERFVLDANGTGLQAELQSISSLRNQATRTIDAVFKIIDTGARLPVTGDLISLEVPIQVNARGAWLPASSLANGIRGLWTVYLATAETDGYKISARTVSVEHIEDARVFVSGAISQDDVVVASGLQRLIPDQRIAEISSVSPKASK